MNDNRKLFHKVVSAALSCIVIASTFLMYAPSFVNAEETTMFTDVESTDYFYEAVIELSARDILAGYGDQTFRPYQSVTRAEAAKVLSLALELDMEAVENPGFEDVEPTDSYYPYVAVLVKAGIMNGFGDNLFKPQEMLTRAQMAKILSIGFALGEANLTNNPFMDVPTDAWYAKYLANLLSNQITFGTTSETFDPTGYVTRGQLAVFVVRSEMAVNPLLIGRVSSGEPVVQATVSLFNSNGDKILEDEEMMTNDYGAIQWGDVDSLPSDFRVVVQGGFVDGAAFSGRLMADFRDFNPKTDSIYVNIVTTMVSVYLDQHPDATWQEAEEAVKRFLDISEWTDLASALHFTGADFSYELFLEEAASNGGLNPFISMLIAELDSGMTHVFHQELPEGAASFIAKELAKGALSYAGGEFAGWGLRSLGLDFEEESLTEEELKKIQEGMEEMKKQLSNMSTQLDAINDKLGNIMSMLQRISHKIDMSSYNGRVSDMSTLIGNVEVISDQLTKLIEDPPANWESWRDKIIGDIKLKILDQDTMIHNQLTGKIAGQQPLLQLWKEIVYNERFLTQEDYSLIATQYDYFRQLQEHMLLLQVEYYHETETTEGGNLSFIEDCIERFTEHMEAQEALLPKPIPETVIVDATADLMYFSEKIAIEYPSSPSPIMEKSSDEVKSHMSELAASHPCDFNDWRQLLASDLYKFVGSKISEFKGTDYLIDNGWPGVKGGGLIVLFVDDYSDVNDDLLYFNSYLSSNFIREYKNKGYDFHARMFPLIMLSRTITAEEYGYGHLKS